MEVIQFDHKAKSMDKVLKIDSERSFELKCLLVLEIINQYHDYRLLVSSLSENEEVPEGLESVKTFSGFLERVVRKCKEERELIYVLTMAQNVFDKIHSMIKNIRSMEATRELYEESRKNSKETKLDGISILSCGKMVGFIKHNSVISGFVHLLKEFIKNKKEGKPIEELFKVINNTPNFEKIF